MGINTDVWFRGNGINFSDMLVLRQVRHRLQDIGGGKLHR